MQVNLRRDSGCLLKVTFFSHSSIQYTKIPGFMETTIFQIPVMQICLKETVSDTNTSNRIFFIDYPASIPSFIPKANLLKSSL